MLNQSPFYRYNNQYIRYSTYNPAFYTQNQIRQTDSSIQNNNTEDEKFKTTNQTTDNPPIDYNVNDLENKKTNFRIGPIKVDNERISLFDFSFAFDDILIIGLIFILLLDSNCDYALIIVLGLILLNISFKDLNFFKFI